MKIVNAKQPLVRSVTRSLSVTESPTRYVFEYKGHVYKIVVPEHFLFDGASIPRLLWTVLGLAPHGPMDGPALIHDFIYHYRGSLPEGSFEIYDKYGRIWVPCETPVTKNMADLLLRDLVSYFKICNRIKAHLVYLAVAVLGWRAWLNDDDWRKITLLQHEAEGYNEHAG